MASGANLSAPFLKALSLRGVNGKRSKIGKANGKVTSGSHSAVFRRIFHVKVPKKRRAHHAIELFQTRNPELVKEALTNAGYDLLNTQKEQDEEDNWTDESQDTAAADQKRTKSARMCMRTRAVRSPWEEVSEAEVEAIKEEIEVEKQKLWEEALLTEQPPQLESTTPWERQQGVDGLDGMFADVHRGAYFASGWVGMTIVGRPNPRMNGDLTLKVICFGQTPSGNDFEACCVNFDQNIIQPFQDFLRICFGSKDTAYFALPVTAKPSTADTPVHRIAISPPDAEPEIAKKSKSKKKKKQQKKNKNADADATVKPLTPIQPSPPAAPVFDDSEATIPTHESDLPPLSSDSPSRCVSPHGSPDGDDDFFEDYDACVLFIRLQHKNAGGMPNRAMMAPRVSDADAKFVINPHLIELSEVSTPVPPVPPVSTPAPTTLPVSTPTLPKPKPTYKGSGATLTNTYTDIFGFSSRDLYRPSGLFEAFGTKKTPVTLQTVSPFGSGIISKTTLLSGISPWLPKSTLPLTSSSAARFLTTVINLTALPPSAPLNTTIGSMWLRSPANTLSLTPPLSDTTPPPLPPLVSDVLPSPPAMTPPSFPVSRPPGRLPVTKLKPSARKASSKSVASKEKAAVVAKKVVSVEEQEKKKRGRPCKLPLSDTTNEIASTSTTAVAPSTSTPTPPNATVATPSAPIYVFSSTNNNRAAAREAAQRDKAVAEKAAVDAAATQAAKRWTERTVDGATVVTFTTHVRKAARYPDGSAVQPEVKRTRGKKMDASEVKLLERVQKRKADESTGGRVLNEVLKAWGLDKMKAKGLSKKKIGALKDNTPSCSNTGINVPVQQRGDGGRGSGGVTEAVAAVTEARYVVEKARGVHGRPYRYVARAGASAKPERAHAVRRTEKVVDEGKQDPNRSCKHLRGSRRTQWWERYGGDSARIQRFWAVPRSVEYGLTAYLSPPKRPESLLVRTRICRIAGPSAGTSAGPIVSYREQFSCNRGYRRIEEVEFNAPVGRWLGQVPQGPRAQPNLERGDALVHGPSTGVRRRVSGGRGYSQTQIIEPPTWSRAPEAANVTGSSKGSAPSVFGKLHVYPCRVEPSCTAIQAKFTLRLREYRNCMALRTKLYGYGYGKDTGTGQPTGFSGRVGPGTGTGSNFSGPETRGYTVLNLLGNLQQA
ncbi:hypothetical protein C8R45DRAFT_1162473 [Mycena sanguinolenta]|nr:hypothetical protein C8R45DRAFT_1162473 [Mycena sanguinolenta]